MCGIAGAVSSNNENLEWRVAAMTHTLQHRGPDDSGVWIGPQCALGHTRLSIIDLSGAARQPISNEDDTNLLVFNGEIYNFQALRRELESQGHQFRARTDAEVVIHAYEQWGVECLGRLRGMFAFAIWDQRFRRLFLARDRVGKKPLFYTQSAGRFQFASELQALLVDNEIEREVDHSAIDSYLSWGYIPAPKTGLKNIFKLPPAHWMTVRAADSRLVIQIERYWSLEYEPKLAISEEEAAEALREKLAESVRLRMISDVPLGAFLSGGIDSSIVVGLMAELSDQPVKTFSIGFEEADYNELDHARRVAQLWGTDHHELIVRPDALAILPKLVRHYGEPYADSSAVPTYYVSQMTRSHVTVALNGDGGDESFAGYQRYFGNRLAEIVRSVPGSALSARAITPLIPGSGRAKGRLRKARRFLSAAASPMHERYGRWIGYFDEQSKQRLYSSDFRSSLNGSRPVDWMESLFDNYRLLHPVEAAMAVDINSYLPYDLLTKVDITSMANSLEARSPFLDHEVMELAARLPVDYKLRGSRSKYILKKAFKDLLPSENLRRGKMGFGVPVGDWFRNGLRELVQDTLLSKATRETGYFDEAEVERLVLDHISGRVDNGPALWNLLMLRLWCNWVLRTR